MTFNLLFNNEFYIFLTIAVVAAVAGIIIARNFFISPVRAKMSVTEEMSSEDDFHTEDSSSDENVGYPSLTVVAYAFCRWENLGEYVESIMAQDYPNFKVVLVCDATSATTSELTEEYALRWPGRFYATFIPPGSHNLSRRKLALTLGIKAADSDYVLTTSSNCRIASNRWLWAMMRPVVESAQRCEVVLGYTSMDFKEFRGLGKWYRQMLDLMRSCQWLSAALKRHPMRGDGYNLLYKRSLFFDRKGYGDTITLEHGDDDIFISSIANAENTAVVLSDDACLTTEWGDASHRMWVQRKQRYDFTRRWLPQRQFILSGLFSALQWMVLSACILAGFFSLPNVVGPGIALAVWGVFVLAEIMLYRRAARALHATALWWSLPWFFLWRPLGNFFFRLNHHSTRNKNFTHRHK